MTPRKAVSKPVPSKTNRRAVPPPDDPGQRRDARPDADDEADRLRAEARLKALKQARAMKR